MLGEKKDNVPLSNKELEFESSMINKIKPYILPVFAIIGILLSIELTIIYFNANFVAGAKPSFCAINETINCDAVARTPFSHFLGLPLSLWGLALYSFILFLSLIPALKFEFLEELKNSKSYIFTVSSVSVIVSLILAGISSMEIHLICILCVITYLLNICILIASKNGTSMLDHYKNSVKDLLSFISEPGKALSLLVVAGISAIGLYYFATSGMFVPKNPIANVDQNIPKYTSTGNVLGAKNPRVVIHEYTDFQCPFCAMSHAMMERLVHEVPGVQVVHHDFPLNGNCNPAIKNSIHKDSCTAALYSRASKAQGKYWELNGKLFDNQQNLSEAKILTMAKELGIDTNKLKKDANDPAAKKQLLNDVKDANDLGITATPTFFIGIKKYEGIMPYPELKNVVLSNMR
jgi:protein-disulfide isomerase/uncharacterized membrane protein